MADESPCMRGDALAASLMICDLEVRDIRFQTHTFIGDAMHTDPDYSAAYVVLKTRSLEETSAQTSCKYEGHGLTFTLGRGTEVVVNAIHALKFLVICQKVSDITDNFGGFWQQLVNESQLRWLGPEKGVMHMATAAIVNAVWDLWAKIEGKPLWKLLVDMEPERLASTIDFRYMSDFMTKNEAIELLKSRRFTAAQRESEMKQVGYPAYSTSVGWLGYSDEKLRELCKEALGKGFRDFKLKVGSCIEDDIRRLKIVREEIGYGDDVRLMVDANQRWEVPEAVEYMKKLAWAKPLWIEEPTSPDDILGHARVRRELMADSNEIKIGVATGEHCANRVIFKQLLQADAVDVVQPDLSRVGGVNEALAICLMAAKAKQGGVPVCFHAGGVGLCEISSHLCFWDYISVSGSLKGRVLEYVDHLHEHFVNPVCINDKGHYVMPANPGSSLEMYPASLAKAEFKTHTSKFKLPFNLPGIEPTTKVPSH